MPRLHAVRGALLALAGFVLSPAFASEGAAKGREVFRGHCMQCHGEKADGRGPLAARYDPPPANIAASRRTDDYMVQIVTLGGAAMGRSATMPQWGLELSGQEILEVVAYLRQVVNETQGVSANARTASMRGGS